jgi:hypothetical protein
MEIVVPILMFVVYQLFVGLWELTKWCARQWRALKFSRWETTEATIEAVDLERTGRIDTLLNRAGWVPVLEYSYCVDGVVHSGRAKIASWHTGRCEAAASADSLVGESFKLRYNPGDTARSGYLASDNNAGALAWEVKPQHGLVLLSLK